MSRPKPKWSPRRIAAGLFLAALAGVVVGCGQQPAPPPSPAPVAVAQSGTDEAGEKAAALTNGDRGTASEIPQTVEQERRAEKNAEAKVKSDPAGAPNAAPVAPTSGPVPPGIPKPTTPAAPEPLTAAAFKSTVTGRSGAARDQLLRAGGGEEPGRPRARLAAGAADPNLPPPPANPAANGDPYDRQQVEAYGVFRENEFRSPLTAALSTFSADVNTASYSNVRRHLTSGHLPPKDAVFLAEFVNYFEYAYPKPKGDDPIAYAIELGPCPWNRQHHLVRVGVQARTIDPAEMPVRNLVFLIDTSGSMSGPTRLPLVKQSLALLIDKLTEKDRVSIVTYAGDASLRLEPTPGNQKGAIKSAVDSLNSGGGTNGGGGIKMAYEQARRTFVEGGVNRVILCTDGDFNIGQTSDAEMVRLVEQERKSGVFLTVLGYGMGNYKDSKLKELANNGNGHYAYIDTIEEAKKVFVEQGGALVTVAKDVKFQVEFNPKRVTAYRLVGYENRLLKDEDFKNDAKDAGDMGSGHQVTVLYEIVPAGVKMDLPGVDPLKYQTAPAPAASDEWLTVKMRYKHPDAETSKELSQSLTGDATAKGKELSDDFRWAAAAASFGMLLRDSKFKGGMTYAGILEEAQGAVGADPNGHRKGFVDVVKKAKELAGGAKAPADAPGN